MIDTVSNRSALATRLRDRIRREGPMTFRDWMNFALYDPQDGYYCRERERWGREGDYRTSPERSGLFAATFARYFATLYESLGSPDRFTILEMGAGNGQFAEGVLQTLAEFFPRVFAATSYVIDEVSPRSKALIQQRLRSFADRVQFKKLEEVVLARGIVFSNELIDSFPVHRLIVRNGQLAEYYVGVNDDKFVWKLDAPSIEVSERLGEYYDLSQLGEGQVFEVNFGVEDWLRQVANSLREGFLVTVDYGFENLFWRSANPNGTLRGFQRHQFVEDLLANPGEHDLTTSVDWSFVKAAGTRAGLSVVDFKALDKFLLDAGLLEQLRLQLEKTTSEGERASISAAAREMVLPDGMAASFQVLVQAVARP